MISTALVTGADGFVGTRLCRLLLQRDWHLIAAHRGLLSSQDFPGMRHERLALSKDTKKWQEALESIDCVVHLAAQVHQIGRDSELQHTFNEVNIEGSRFVAEQCVRSGVKRLVFISTAKVNGEGGDLQAYDALDPPHPQDAYARSKLAAELAIRSICAPAGVEFVIIRPPLVYGPGVRANFRRLLRIAELGVPLPLASIDNRRSLVCVDNLADFIETCMTHPKAHGRVWLISDGEDVSTPELIRRLARCMGKRAILFRCPTGFLRSAAALVGLSAEAERLCNSFTLDSTPARAILDWNAPMSLDEGLLQAVMDYKTRRKI